MLLGLDKLLEEPAELNGLLYMFGLTLAELLILSILDNLLLRLLELVLLNLSLIFVFVRELVLEDIAFLEPLLPLIRDTGVLKSLP